MAAPPPLTRWARSPPRPCSWGRGFPLATPPHPPPGPGGGGAPPLLPVAHAPCGRRRAAGSRGAAAALGRRRLRACLGR